MQSVSEKMKIFYSGRNHGSRGCRGYPVKAEERKGEKGNLAAERALFASLLLPERLFRRAAENNTRAAGCSPELLHRTLALLRDHVCICVIRVIRGCLFLRKLVSI